MKYGKMPLLSERHSKPNSATLILRERAAAFHGHLDSKKRKWKIFHFIQISYKFKGIKNKFTGTPHYVALYFASQVPFFFFFFGPKLISGNPELSKSLGTIFSPKHLFILCLCVTFLIVLTIFQMFSLLLYLL